MSINLNNINDVYEIALANIQDFVYVIGIDHRFIYANTALLEMWGRSPENTFGLTFTELGYEKWHADMHDQEIDKVIRTRKSIRSEVPFTGTQGRRIYDYIFSPVFNDDGEVIAIAGTTRDITDRKKTEESLSKKEERDKIALEASEFVGIWSWDIEKNLVTSDERFAELYSVNPEAAIHGVPIEEFFKTIYPEDLKRIAPVIEVVSTQGGEFSEEYRIVQANGSLRWVVARGRCHLNAEGKPVRFAGAVVDITERKHAEEKSDQQRRVYETALENTADFNYVFNLQGKFSYTNKALADILGRTHDEVVGRNFFELGYPAELAQRLQDEIQEVITTKKPLKNETPFSGVNGPRAYEYIFRPVMRDDGTVEAVAGSTRDITDYKEANYRKDEFLAMLSHELRNPLAPISNAINIMRSPTISPQLREEAAALVDRQLVQITNLLNDLLDVSRLTLGKIELRCEKVTLSELITMAVQSIQPMITSKAQTLNIQLPQSDIFLYADSTRLSQVFSNLLNNAAKYTPNGGDIAISAFVDRNNVIVNVKDNGIGLSKEALPRIFDLFAQVDSSMERSYGGLGIGLTLVKNLVEMHDGSVTVQSEGIGKGSLFSVRLPIELPVEVPQESAVTAPSTPDAARYRIMVVDDNEASAKTLGWTLELLGHDVQLAHEGEKALEMAQSYAPHIVLLDIGLPRMNGYEVCEALRKIPSLKHLVIIAQTGWGQKEHLQRSRDAGFDHHLVKPIRMETLEEIIAGISLKHVA